MLACAGVAARRLRRRVLDRRTIERYLQTHPTRKLQLGTGPNPLPGWLNTDLLPDTYPELRGDLVLLDAAGRFPLADMTFDYIFSEHQVEHIPEPDAREMVRECFRVLRPGGRIRIATPDLAAIVGLYDERLDATQQHYIDWVMRRFRPHVGSGDRRCYVINHIFSDHSHRFIYDFDTMAAILTDAGFVAVVRRDPGESDDPALRGVESHGRAIGDEDVNRFESLVVEAQRPVT
jgi:SAM-dependent methyltransferase